MSRYVVILLIVFLLLISFRPGDSKQGPNPLASALAQGDAMLKEKEFEKALSAYRAADKLSHHTCADCLLGMFVADRHLGNLEAALDDAKQAAKASGNEKVKAASAHMLRGALLAQMASKPNDRKLREAEAEAREAAALVPGLATAHFLLGKILIGQERDEEGIQELKSYLNAPGGDRKSLLSARRIISNPIRGREPFAPDVSFVTLEGEKISNADLRGKVVLFDFWGAWCPPCRESLPMLLSIRKKYRDRPFEMVGISSDEDERLWKSFIASHHMDWPEYLDRDDQVGEAFEVDSYPTFIVVDRDGVIRYHQAGWNPVLPMEMDDAINKALKRPSNPAVLAAAATSVTEETAAARPSEPSLAGAAKPASIPPEGGIPAESGGASGNVYRDDALGFSYQFPPGWIAAAPETIRAATEIAQAAAKAKFLEQHPGMNADFLAIPKIIFYASQSGRGDGQQIAIPCVRISFISLPNPNITLAQVNTHQGNQAPPGMTMTRGPEELVVNGQEFLRTDFETTERTPRVLVSRVMTITRGSLLSLECLAADKEMIERLASPTALTLLHNP